MTDPTSAGPSPRLILAVTLLGVTSTSFPVTVFSAALPRVADDLGTTDAIISWVISGPLLALAVATPLAGKLGDLIGHRRMYLWGFALATLFSLATAFAWNAPSLIAMRILGQGMGAATMPAALAIIMQTFHGSARSRALGWWSAISALSPTLGAILGGLLIEATSWRAVFIVQAVISALVLVPAARILPETARQRGVRFDILGGVTLAGAAASLLLAVNRGPALGWEHPLVIGGFVAAPILTVTFIVVERHVEQPLLPLPLLTEPGFALPATSTFFSQGAYMGSLVVTPFLLETAFGYGTGAVALILTARAVSFSGGSWAGGQLARKLGIRRIALTGSTCVTLGILATGLGGRAGVVLLIIVSLALTGFGQGFSRPVLVASVGDSVGDAHLGVGSGAFSMAGLLGASVGITVLTTLLVEDPVVDDFVVVYVVGAVMAGCAVVILSRLRSRRITREPTGS